MIIHRHNEIKLTGHGYHEEIQFRMNVITLAGKKTYAMEILDFQNLRSKFTNTSLHFKRIYV